MLRAAPEVAGDGSGLAPSLLSELLATRELGTLDGAALSEIVAAEAVDLLGGRRAAVWLFRPALQRLFLEQRGHEIRSVSIDDDEVEELLVCPAVWELGADALRYRLVEASFGVPGPDRTETLALPLPGPAGPVGLLVVEFAAGEAPAPDLVGLAAFPRQVAAVVSNHGALEDARRHESQLEALYQTAGELSAKLELPRVLEAIIERARVLADTPIAYITLVDKPAGEIYMRAACGVTSPGFRDIRLKIGTGLGGATAQQSRPFYTSDYLNDARFAHDTAVDSEVRHEGIKSILGVPMRAGDEFVGVLFAADRTVRVFTEADVDILVSLAHHAGLAIENAALYERATAALAEAGEMNRLVEAQNRRLRRVDDAHRQLSEAMLAGQGLPEIIGLLAEQVGSQVAVLDDRQRLLAAAGTPPDGLGERLAGGGVAPVRLSAEETRVVARAEADAATAVLGPCPPERASARLLVPIIARAEVLGTVWVEVDPSALDEQRPVVEQAARVVALELLKQRSIAEVERRLRSELLNELLAERAVRDPGLERHAADLGVDLRIPHRLMVSAMHGGHSGHGDAIRRNRDELAAALRGASWCDFVAEHAGRVVALILPTADDLTARMTRVGAAIGHEERVRTAISPPCHATEDYAAQFVVCDRALELLADELAEPVVDLDELRVLTLLFRPGKEEELRAFVDARLGPVLRYDERRRTDLARTLGAYLEADGSPARTAATLHVHVNTVYYRLERLRALLGEDFASSRKRLDLQIALLARRLTVSL